MTCGARVILFLSWVFSEDPNHLTARGILHQMKNTVKKVKQTAKDMFTARGLLDKVKGTVNNAGKKVEEYTNKAKGKLDE